MINLMVFCRPGTSSRLWMTWFVLFALLLVQIRVATSGCLISGFMSPPRAPERLMQMQTAADPCAVQKPADMQPCMEHCAQSSDITKFTFYMPFVLPAMILAGLSLFTAADASHLKTSAYPPATTGPPLYLRFLRLLN